jgi:broad specificity phosphatase PhoE
MTAARLVLWRHGQTEWNVDNRFQGQADIPLDALGREQARLTAPVLAALGPTALYASDLTRTYETAQALAAVTGLEILTDKRLREIHVGSWEGLTGAEVDLADPELSRRLRAGEDVRRSETGESPSEVAERMAAVLTEIAESAEDGSTVAVVTHGLAGRVGTCRFVGIPFESWRLFGSLFNCSWLSLNRHRSGAYWQIERYNVDAIQPGDDSPPSGGPR